MIKFEPVDEKKLMALGAKRLNASVARDELSNSKGNFCLSYEATALESARSSKEKISEAPYGNSALTYLPFSIGGINLEFFNYYFTGRQFHYLNSLLAGVRIKGLNNTFQSNDDNAEFINRDLINKLATGEYFLYIKNTQSMDGKTRSVTYHVNNGTEQFDRKRFNTKNFVGPAAIKKLAELAGFTQRTIEASMLNDFCSFVEKTWKVGIDFYDPSEPLEDGVVDEKPNGIILEKVYEVYGDTEENLRKYWDLFITTNEYNKKYLDAQLYVKTKGKILDNMIMDCIPLLPIGFRLYTEDGPHPLTIEYKKLCDSLCDMETLLSHQNFRWAAFLNCYKEIYKHITSILDSKEDGDEKYKSLKQMLSGKKGLVRKDMIGARMDYSSRLVICMDPSISFDTVGVPYHTLAYLMEYELYKKYRAENRLSSLSNLVNNWNQTKKDIDAILKSRPDTVVVIGRQPTLFNLGIQAYKIRAVEGHALRLNPLCVMPFNADFDGDQMHLSMPLDITYTDESGRVKSLQGEVKDAMLSVNNILYPRNGSITVESRHEIQYGLYIASTMFEPLREGAVPANITEKDLPEMSSKDGDAIKDLGLRVFNAVVKNKIAIYDNILFSVEKYGITPMMTAGQAAIKFLMGPKFKDIVIGSVPLCTAQEKEAAFAKFKEEKIILDNDTKCTKGERINQILRMSSSALTGVDKALLKEYNEWVDLKNKQWNGEFTVKFCEELFKASAEAGSSSLVRCVNNVIKLGFAVSAAWPPSLAALKFEDKIQDDIKEFDKKVDELAEQLEEGLITESIFQSEFDDLFNGKVDMDNHEIKGLSKKIEERLEEKKDASGNDLPIDKRKYAGWLKMIKSKAKGSNSDLVQALGIRGRMQKDDSHSFNNVIYTSLAKQLNPLEHFVTSYGSRKGLADKILATAKPGYLTRMVSHAASYLEIVCDDCGDTDGLLLTYDDLYDVFSAADITSMGSIAADTISEKAQKLIVGRNIITNNGSIIKVTKGNVKDIIKEYIVEPNQADPINPIIKPGLKMRSPITCNNPCCKVCYGDGTYRVDKKVEDHKRVGILAATSVTEPGTQLTMKNFQKGGVASDANLTSSFDRINSMFRLQEPKPVNGLCQVDHIAPEDCIITERRMGNGIKLLKVNSVETGRTLYNNIKVDERLKVKSRPGEIVKAGTGLQQNTGVFDIKEIKMYGARNGESGVDRAIKYVLLSLWDIFNQEKDINLIHFECIVYGLVYYVVSKSDAVGVNNGEYLSRAEYLKVKDKVEVGKDIVSAWDVPNIRHDALQHFIVEDIGEAIGYSLARSNTDSFTDYKVRAMFGKI